MLIIINNGSTEVEFVLLLAFSLSLMIGMSQFGFETRGTKHASYRIKQVAR